MGVRNFLVEGVSGTGKTSVCEELQRRGYRAVHGDRELAYQGDPETGAPTDGRAHEHHLWRVDRVRALVADREDALTFFCGGSRNFAQFLDLFDGVFVLDVDVDTLHRRLDERPDSEWGGGKAVERELVARLHRTREDVPHDGIPIDATAPITEVVDEIVRTAKRIADARA
jgi:broad-specificity NMP kinase